MSYNYEFETASAVWSRLEGIRQPLMRRVERYAALTIPKVCLPDGFNVESKNQSHDYQSLGAQAVNHVVNKLMIAMFAPSRPFFKVQEGPTTKAQAAKANLTEVELGAVLAKMERDSVKTLDGKGQRPKLYQINRHLVVTGNCLLVMDKDQLRVMGLKHYCVKRTHDGKVHTLVIREQMRFDELDTTIQDLWSRKYNRDSMVYHYRLICRTPQGGYTMKQYIDEAKLPEKYDARWSAEKMPYHALAWDLTDEADYGTGLVEDYSGDFESLSVLSESIVTGAVVGTEFRWVANPNGMTSVDDLRDSVNGDVLAGSAKDVDTISPKVAEALKIAQSINADYIQRISRGFLMGSAVTRQAERVTAEEVRLTAMELEASFGGVYSALAPSLQTPVAKWLLTTAGTSIAGTDLDIAIITGLDALSRNGDLENLRLAMGDLAALANAPDELKARIKWQQLATFVGTGRGVDIAQFIMNDKEYGQVVAQQQAAQTAQEVNTARGTAQAEADANPQPTA
jgi:hypothetical protein